MSLASAIRETFTGFKSLIIGLRITGREAVKPIITVQYPRETLKMPARFRGHIQLTIDPETGRPRCTACGLCMKACPSECIDLDGMKREGEKKKSVSRYELDFTKCSLCGSCVEICPSDAIDFSKDYNVVSLNRDTFGHMDLYAKVDAKSKEWAKANPEKAAAAAAAAVAAAAAAAAKPAASASGAAAPKPASATAPSTTASAATAPTPKTPTASAGLDSAAPEASRTGLRPAPLQATAPVGDPAASVTAVLAAQATVTNAAPEQKTP